MHLYAVFFLLIFYLFIYFVVNCSFIKYVVIFYVSCLRILHYLKVTLYIMLTELSSLTASRYVKRITLAYAISLDLSILIALH